MQHNIITFGSCLSRYVARSYKRLYGGNITASVYHNRSDYFILQKQSPIKTEMLSCLKSAIPASALDEDSANIVKNQTTEGVGRHKIDTTTGMVSLLEQRDSTLLIMDNFMDISAKLSRSRKEGWECFLRPKDYQNHEEHFSLENYLDPIVSARNFEFLIQFLLDTLPNIKIFLIHFPYNTYTNQSERQNRSLGFLKAFQPAITTVIQPQSIPRIYRTNVPSHFEELQYAAYAAMIRTREELLTGNARLLTFSS